MSKEESQCWMRKELEIFKASYKKKLDKQVRITKTILLYKERVNSQPMKWKDLKLKWKDNADKQ